MGPVKPVKPFCQPQYRVGAMLVFAILSHFVTADAAVVVMRNGMVLEGQLGYIASIDVNPLVTQDPAGQVE